MAIRLEITDPQHLSQDDILNTANYLLSLKGLKLTAFAQQRTEANQQRPVAPALAPAVPTSPSPGFEAVNKEVNEIGDKIISNIVNTPPSPIPPAFNPFAKTPAPAIPPVLTEDVTTELKGSEYNFAEKDRAGMPWDKRIHSRTKSQTSDGKWRYQRGIDDAAIAVVEAEIKQAMGAAPNPALATIPPAEIPAPTPIVPPIPAPIPHVEFDFPYFMDRVGHLVHTKIITQAEVNEVLISFGVPNIPSLPTVPDAITKVCNRINEIAANRGA